MVDIQFLFGLLVVLVVVLWGIVVEERLTLVVEQVATDAHGKQSLFLPLLGLEKEVVRLGFFALLENRLGLTLSFLCRFVEEEVLPEQSAFIFLAEDFLQVQVHEDSLFLGLFFGILVERLRGLLLQAFVAEEVHVEVFREGKAPAEGLHRGALLFWNRDDVSLLQHLL